MNARTAAYVRAVAEAGSFSKAAAKLYISQPSLSEHILKAEKAYGVKFFNRKTTPVVLTYAGEVFLKAADKMAQMDEQLTRELGDIGKHATGRIIIGESPTMSADFIPTLFKAFHQRFPDVKLALREGTNPELIEDVKHGRADLAFVSNEVSDLASVPVVTRPLFLARALKDGEKIGEVQEIATKTLEGKPFILLKEGREIRKLSDAFFRRCGIRPEIAYETTSYTLAMRLSEAGFGWTFVVGDDKRRHHLQCFRSDDIAPYHVHLIYRKDSYLSGPLQYFIDLSKQVDDLTDF